MPSEDDCSIKTTLRPHIFKHVLLSNVLMLLLSMIAAYYIPLFSNQSRLAYQGYDLTLRQGEGVEVGMGGQRYHHQQQQSTPTAHAITHMTRCELRQQGLMPIVQRWIASHANFDGLQFHSNRYEYQSNFAFIKGYVMVVAGVKWVVEWVKGDLLGENNGEVGGTMSTTCIVRANQSIELVILILINKLFFSLAAYKVYSITLHLTTTTPHNLAHSITLLYLYNPACVFFHSIYTESIYAFLTFTSIDQLLKSQLKTMNNGCNHQKQQQMLLWGVEVNGGYVRALGVLWLAVFFRTNAVFLSTMFGLPIIYQLWRQIRSKNIINIIKTLIKGTLILAFILSPLIYYQSHIYHQLCNSQIDLTHDKNLLFQCSKPLPNLYSFIQHKFWNVGFFSYWRLSNAVFILLGIPALIVGSIIFQQTLKLCKGLFIKITRLQVIKLGLYLSFLILFIVTLTLTNIQSSTRFFSTHIIFYLLIYEWLSSKLVTWWIFSYYSFGAVLFFIGFPWT